MKTANDGGQSGWHETQKLTAERDGGLLAEFRLSDTEEIKRWILSFGRYAEVLEPEELRRDLGAEIESMLRKYSPERSVEVTHD